MTCPWLGARSSRVGVAWGARGRAGRPNRGPGPAHRVRVPARAASAEQSECRRAAKSLTRARSSGKVFAAQAESKPMAADWAAASAASAASAPSRGKPIAQCRSATPTRQAWCSCSANCISACEGRVVAPLGLDVSGPARSSPPNCEAAVGRGSLSVATAAASSPEGAASADQVTRWSRARESRRNAQRADGSSAASSSGGEGVDGASSAAAGARWEPSREGPPPIPPPPPPPPPPPSPP